MKFETRQYGEVTLIQVCNDTLDAGNVGEFKRDIMPQILNRSKVVFDLKQLQFIDSSGLGAILSCLRQLNGQHGDLKLSNMQKTVRVLFELVRMDRIFDIVETPEDAILAFQP